MEEARRLFLQHKLAQEQFYMTKEFLANYLEQMIPKIQEQFSPEEHVRLDFGGVYPYSFDIIVTHRNWNSAQIPWSIFDSPDPFVEIVRIVEKTVAGLLKTRVVEEEEKE